MALTRPDCLPARHTPAMVVPPQPQPVLPSVDARQLAAQQQDFINQQARILVRMGRALDSTIWLPGLPMACSLPHETGSPESRQHQAWVI